MDNKIQMLSDEELDLVTGGDITYTWNGTSGTIGIDGNNKFILVDKDKFVEYYKSVRGTMSDGQILSNLYQRGIIKKRS